MKAIVSVIGKDQVGILAMVAGECAAANVNILDVNQTIVDGIFTMTMSVDILNPDLSVSQFGYHLENLGSEMNLVVRVMHQDIFDSMHRI